MSSITTIKDLVSTLEVTSDIPEIYGGNSPTWSEFKGKTTPQRIGGESENPSEEPVEQEIQDGRSVQASVQNHFSLQIFERDGVDTVYNTFLSASKGSTKVWLRRTGEQDEATAEIIGGELGMTVTMGKEREGYEGHRLFAVQLYVASVFAGNTTVVPEILTESGSLILTESGDELLIE